MYLPRYTDAQANQRVTLNWAERFQQLAQTAADPRLQQYYLRGAVTPDTPLAEVPFVAMDFETTGLNPRKHSILSVGLVPFNLQRIRCRESRHWLVNPRKELVEESVVFHGITHSDIDDKPDLIQVLKPLLDAMAGAVIVVHHRSIERGFLDASLHTRLGEGIEFPVIDTLELEARLHRRKPPGLIARLMGRKPESIRLADSRTRYNLPYYQPHHALTDAIATAELLQAQIATHYSPDTPVSELW